MSRIPNVRISFVAALALALIATVVALTDGSAPSAGAVGASASAGGGASLCYGEVVVAQENADAVAVIDQFSNLVTTTIGVQPQPSLTAFSGDGRLLFVRSYTNQSIRVIDTATNTTVRTLTFTDSPGQMITNRDGSALWVDLYDGSNHSLVKLNAVTGATLATYSLMNYANQLFLSPNESVVWATVYTFSTVDVFELDANTLNAMSTTSTGSSAFASTMSADGSRIYLADYSGTGIVSFNTSTHAVSTIGTVSQPRDVAVSPSGTTLYVFAGSNVSNYRLYAIDVATGQATQGMVLAPLANGAVAVNLRITADGSKLYVTFANYANGGIGVFSTSNLTTGVFLPMEVYVPVAVCPLTSDPAPATTTTTTSDPVVPTFTA